MTRERGPAGILNYHDPAVVQQLKMLSISVARYLSRLRPGNDRLVFAVHTLEDAAIATGVLVSMAMVAS
jgi:hypothetical protein